MSSSELIEINRNYILNDQIKNIDSDLFDFNDENKVNIKDIDYFKKNYKENCDAYVYKITQNVKYYHSKYKYVANFPKSETRHYNDLIEGGLKDSDRTFSTAVVWAPTNHLDDNSKPLPCLFVFHGGGTDNTGLNFLEWIELRTNNQIDGVPPKKTFGEIYGYIVIYMNGFFGIDTNTLGYGNNIVGEGPNHQKSGQFPWWYTQDPEPNNRYLFPTLIEDVSEFLDFIDNKICKLDKSNVTFDGLSVGSHAIISILEDMLKNNYPTNKLITKFTATIPNGLTSIIKKTRQLNEKYPDITPLLVCSIGGEDGIYNQNNDSYFKFFMDNYPYLNQFLEEPYLAIYMEDWENSKQFVKDITKNDNFQTEYYYGKIKNSNVEFFILYTIGGDHSHHTRDTIHWETLGLWPTNKDLWTFQKKYEIYTNKKIYIN